MKKWLVAGLTATLALLPGPGVGAAEIGDGGEGCREPEAVWEYGDASMTYGLEIDLAECGWWDGSPITLSAELSRFDAVSEHGTGTLVMCGLMWFGDGDGRDARRRAASRCRISTSVEHPPVDAARYRGEITYPWEDGERSVNFDAVCGYAGLRECQEIG